MNKINSDFIIGIPSEWGDLIPPLQHTAFADAIIGNQFEPLIKIDKNGTKEPLAAESWTISPNFREIKFKINRIKRFSNGRTLTAEDFKDSWENGLSMTPRSANSSLRDLLEWVEGYDEFNQTKKISGLIVDGDYFIIRLRKPYRAIFDFISNNRFAAYLNDNGKFLGTGKYVIVSDNGVSLEMIPNRYYEHSEAFPKIRINMIRPQEAERLLSSGEIHAYLFADKAIIKSCLIDESGTSIFKRFKAYITNKDTIRCISGREGKHEVVILNGLAGRFFSEQKYRKAIQALLCNEIKKVGLPEYMRMNKTKLDPQVYVDFQAGRLSDKEVEQIIHEGGKYILEFIAATHYRPLYLTTADSPNWVQQILEKQGVKFTSNSGVVTRPVYIEQYYKKHVPDLMVGGFSFANGDPDGLYHALGDGGAIFSPMLKRPRVGEMLDSGRQIIEKNAVDKHYKQLSKVILEEVPFVHIGFSLGIVAYRSDKVKVNTSIKNRETYGLEMFKSY